MNNQTKLLLQKLQQTIDQLENSIEPYQQLILNSPCFDISLFKRAPAKAGYNFYFLEIKHNYQKLEELVEKNNHGQYFAAIEYLTEHLCYQIEALNRELANIQPEDRTNSQLPTQSLYDKYNIHLDYLRRLKAMKYELQQFDKSNPTLLQKMTVLDQRIARCQYALMKLEEQIDSL